MIAGKAGGATYPDLARDRLLEPLGLHESFPLDGLPPPALTAGVAGGDAADGECQEFEPPGCKTGIVAPPAGRDIRDADRSWAGAAGATVASPRDLARRFRALHGGRVPAPAQFAEMEHVVPCCA